MKDNVLEITKKYAGWIILLIAFLILNSSIVNYTDDEQFLNAIDKYGNIVNWALFYGNNWGGRIVSHGILVILLQLPDLIFSLINGFMMWLTVFLFDTVLLNRRCREKIMAPLIMGIFFIYFIPDSMSLAMFWKCAAVIYLWGFPAMLLFVWPFILQINKTQIRTYQLVLAFLGALYLCGTEQTAVFALVFSGILFFYNIICNKKTGLSIIILLVSGTLLSLVCFGLPGNAYRSIEETIAWQNNFGSVNIWEKIIMGISYGLNFLCDEAAVLMVVICMGITYMYFLQKRKWYLRAMAVLSLIYYGLAFLNYMIQIKNPYFEKLLFGRLFSYIPFTEIKMDYSITSIAATYTGVLILLITAVLLSGLYKDQFDLIPGLLLLGSFGTMFIMGFSPTLNASGERSLFPGMVLIMFVCGQIILGIIALKKK